MALSEIRVNTTKTRTGVGTITYTETGPVITGIATASNFKTGSTNVHSTGVELANINTGGSTATFGGPISGTTASFSGNVSIGGTLTYEDVTNIDSIGIITAKSGIHLEDYIFHKGDTNTSIGFPSADTVFVKTAGVERFRIESNGDVEWNNVGTPTPGEGNNTVGMGFEPRNGTIFLSRGSNALIISNRNNDGRHIHFNQGGTGKFAIGLQNSGADLAFFSGAGNSPTEKIRITSDGVLSWRSGLASALSGTGNPYSLNIYRDSGSGYGYLDCLTGSTNHTGWKMRAYHNGSYRNVIAHSTSDYTWFETGGSERLKINSYGQIITGGGSGISHNNVGNSAFGSFFEINGTHTINHHGVLGISGKTNTNNQRVGLIQFLNTENSNSSSNGSANSRSLAHISVYADTSDSNAGDDCGGRIVIGTKGEAAAMNDLLFLTSDKTVGIQAIPAVGDLNSTATGGAALSDPKLYVQDGGTNGKYTLMIRCNGGSDADNTGSAIALNHSNDRGILIEGGRWSGNRSWGALKAIDNVGRVTDAIAIRGGNGAGVQDVRIYTGEAVSTTERLRIDNTGRLTLGEANFTASNDVHIKRANAGGDVALRITNNTNQNSGSTASLYFTTSPTQDFNTAYIKAVRSGGRLEFGYATNRATVVMHNDLKVGIARTTNSYQLDTSGTPSDTGCDTEYNLSINRECFNSTNTAYLGFNKTLNVDNQYAVSTFRAPNINRNGTTGWMDVAYFVAWDLNARVIIQAGGTFTGDQIDISVISSYNSALANSRSGPILEVRRTEGHNGGRFTKVRIGCHNSNRRPILQVYFDGSAVHNADGTINVTCHDYGSNYGGWADRGEARFQSATTLNETWEELDIHHPNCDYFNTSTTPAFMAYKSDNSGQIASGDYVYNTQLSDRGGHNYNTSNGRYTAPCDGLYYVHANIQLYGSGTGGKHCIFKKNGSDILSGGTSSPFYDEPAGAHHNIYLFGVYSLSTDDYLTVHRNGQSRGMQSAFCGFLIR